MELWSLKRPKIHICQWQTIFQSLSYQILLHLAPFTTPSIKLSSHYPHSSTFLVHLFWFFLDHTISSSPCPFININIAQDSFYHPIALVYIFLRWFHDFPHSNYYWYADDSQHASLLHLSSNKFYRTILHFTSLNW